MYAPGQQEPVRGAGQGTAFRAAEKRYQLCKELVTSGRRGRRRNEYAARPLDLSGVCTLEGDDGPGTRLGPVPGLPPTATAFAFAAHPGLLVVRGALPPEQQRQLVVAALTQFNEPPNHTTHIRAYPAGLPGIWAAAQAGLRLQQPAGDTAPTSPDAGHSNGGKEGGSSSGGNGSGREDTSSSAASIWGPGGSGPTAESLLRKLRWATLGPPYDWTRRLYLRDAPHMPLPPELRQLAAALAGMAQQLLLQGYGSSSSSSSATVCNATNCPAAGAVGCLGEEEQQGQQQPPHQGQQCGCQRLATPYCPDAALVNFYYEGDTLNGHVDDAERCLHQPLVSLSLGCPAIFLMGAETKEVPPTALLLRSGDAVVLSGPARRCYHGVPRILTDHPPAEALRCCCRCTAAEAGSSCGEPPDGSSCEDPAFAPFARHMQRCRINISIRDTR